MRAGCSAGTNAIFTPCQKKLGSLPHRPNPLSGNRAAPAKHSIQRFPEVRQGAAIGTGRRPRLLL